MSLVPPRSAIEAFGGTVAPELLAGSGALEPGRAEFCGDQDPYGAAVELAVAISS